jgi:hypothetical protein
MVVLFYMCLVFCFLAAFSPYTRFFSENGNKVRNTVKMRICLYKFFKWFLRIIYLTIRDGRHAKHRQNGRGVLFTPWGIFILYNATSPF